MNFDVGERATEIMTLILLSSRIATLCIGKQFSKACRP